MASTDRLARYRDRRDFARTPEPDAVPGAGGGRTYAIQKHAARRLHFDLRLEHDGVLLSFAITRGPSLDPAVKRLAVRTEDHPLDYATFEGTIPKDEYGGGTVMLWDRGTWEPRQDPDEGLRRGKLSFRLHGERLSGDFALVRMDGKGDRQNWLLVKERDGREDPDADPVARFMTSVATGRTMEEIAEGDPPAGKARGRGGKAKGKTSKSPRFVPPMLATLVDAAPEGEDYLHEIKYDGYRIVAVLESGKARLFTRAGKDWTGRFGRLAEAVAELDATSAVLDGEAVAFDAGGMTDFSTLQGALDGKGEIGAYLFDCLFLDGRDLRAEPLTARKAALRKLIDGKHGTLFYSDHVKGNGPAVLEEACRLGAEGIVSKQRDGHYRSGRSRGWLKAKCVNEEEVVVGGFAPSTVRGKPFASLLVGTYEGGRLVYRGRVGSGYRQDDTGRLARHLERLRRKTSPFANLPRRVAQDARFVRPELVAVIRYAELTADGIFRHASFRALRTDKPAGSVSRGGQRAAGEAAARKEDRAVRLTSPDKVLAPAAALTKKGLADYFEAVAAAMLPHVANRPLSLVRCPDGRPGKCFFQKHHTAGLPAALKPVSIEEKDGDREPYIVIEDADGLAACAQVGALELHVWGAPAGAVDRPDRLVLDLDPGDGLAFADVKRAAREVRDLLDAVGMASFPLLTGGKGIHVVVPLDGRAQWQTAKPFAEGLARALATAAPDRYVARASKAARKGRIFIDWLRNARGATAIAPFSPRAKAAAPVATPIAWDELSRIDRADAYTVESLPRRLAHLGRDPWEAFDDARVTLDGKAVEAVRAHRA